MKDKSEMLQEAREAILNAYVLGQIQTFDDFDKVFAGAWATFGVNDGNLRGGILRAIKASSPVMVGLRKKVAEANWPITLHSPIEHLPFSIKTYNVLKRSALVSVKGLVNFLAKEGECGFLGIRNAGEGTLEEVYDALEWAGIEIPEFEGEEEETGESVKMSTCLWEGFDEEEGAAVARERSPLENVDAIEKRIIESVARTIVLEPGESFRKEFSFGEPDEFMIGGLGLSIKARKFVIEATG